MTHISSHLKALFAAALLFISGAVMAAEGEVVSTKQNKDVYAGNAALGTSPSGRKFRVYFGKDGTVRYNDSKGLSQTGKWIITDDGMMCYDWRRWKDRCYSHRKDGDVFQSYRDGKTKGSRFKIAPGNVGLPK